MEDYFKNLLKSLYTESEEAIPAIKRKSRRRRRCRSLQRSEVELPHPAIGNLLIVLIKFNQTKTFRCSIER